jgi:hypothetical protein
MLCIMLCTKGCKLFHFTRPLGSLDSRYRFVVGIFERLVVNFGVVVIQIFLPARTFEARQSEVWSEDACFRLNLMFKTASKGYVLKVALG